MTYQQSVFKLYHSDKHFSEFYLQDGVKNQLAYRYGTKLGPIRQYVTVSPYAFKALDVLGLESGLKRLTVTFS